MPISDVYTARSGVYTGTAVTTAVPFLSVFGTAAKRSWVVGIRVDVILTTAAAGNNVTFALNRCSTTTVATSPVSLANQHDVSAPASISQQCVAYGTPPATITQTLWEQLLPLTTGSSWEEFPPSGYEWQIPAIASGSASCGVHMFLTQSVATSGYTYAADLIISE
jgi:hypothetical protein